MDDFESIIRPVFIEENQTEEVGSETEATGFSL
jgi:hypothetical protein